MDKRQETIRKVFLKNGHKTFEYGKLDCCLFVAKVVKELTGNDYSVHFHHKNEEEALEYLNSYGGLEELVSYFLGPPTDNEPEDGNPVLVNLKGCEFLGVFVNGKIICKAKRGLLSFSPEYAMATWKLNLNV